MTANTPRRHHTDTIMLTRQDADSKAEGEGSVNDASHEDDVSAASKIGGQILADSDDNHDGLWEKGCGSPVIG